MDLEHAANEYDWLADEIASVRTRNYFVIHQRVLEGADSPLAANDLPMDYRAFIARFGQSMLYRQRIGYGIGVLAALPQVRPIEGEKFIRFGHYLERNAYFSLRALRETGASVVYEDEGAGLARVKSSFSEWLRARSREIRERLGTRWAEVLAGPAPFSELELEIVAVRRMFRWNWVGTDADGNELIEVFNGSSRTLPFLSIDVRSRKGDFEGRVFVPVSGLLPGETRVFARDCYKKLLPHDLLELVDPAEPTPEEREHLWEFRAR